MKSMRTNEGGKPVARGGRLGSACVKSCRGILARIARSREAIYAEARSTLKVQDQMLRLALNEAEALAWQTLYPHLLFPALASEKIQGVAAWNHRQRWVGGQIPTLPI
jgi:hypothetical protein